MHVFKIAATFSARRDIAKAAYYKKTIKKKSYVYVYVILNL